MKGYETLAFLMQNIHIAQKMLQFEVEYVAVSEWFYEFLKTINNDVIDIKPLPLINNKNSKFKIENRICGIPMILDSKIQDFKILIEFKPMCIPED